MVGIRKTIGMCAIASLSLATTSGSAFAACAANAMNGSWHFFALQNQTPAIKPANQTVDTGNNVTKTIKVFPNSGGFENGTSTIIRCTITVSGASATAANLAGTCAAQNITKADGGGGISVSGNVMLSACTVTGGTLNVSGDPKVVTFLGGHFNGTMGTGIARQDHKEAALNAYTQVFLWTMIKN